MNQPPQQLPPVSPEISDDVYLATVLASVREMREVFEQANKEKPE